MARYVDIECSAVTEVIGRRAFKNREDIQDFLDNIPTADVEPVKHGHWYNRGGRFRCSVCDTKAYLKDVGGTGGWSHEYIQQKSPYCPNCGAKMDGEEVQE